jgi:ppGpp synthetase/RelA/SpoT-type nucleotidyltranferase
MAWAVPEHSRSHIDAAGELLVRDDAVKVNAAGEFIDDGLSLERWGEREQALRVINNWRSSHSFPLNTLQVGLRRVSQQLDSRCLAAQRIKRLSSISLKLRRFPGMSQMQDLGGCRAVVRSVRQVRGLVGLYQASTIKHKLDHVDDYITRLQRSGYRGIHLIWRYYSDKKKTYNGLKIEM